MAGQKNFCLIKGPKCIFFYPFNGCFFNKQGKYNKFGALRAKSKAIAGHIRPAGRMLCTPALCQMQKKQHKSTGAKAVHKLLVKLILIWWRCLECDNVTCDASKLKFHYKKSEKFNHNFSQKYFEQQIPPFLFQEFCFRQDRATYGPQRPVLVFFWNF